MIAPSLEREILDEISRLSDEDTRKVLNFVRSLGKTAVRGETLDHLLGIIGSIPSADLAEMSRAIEEGCEQVDSNGW